MHYETSRRRMSLPEGRRSRTPASSSDAPGSSRSAKGHDAILKALQDNGRKVEVRLLSGEELTGKVVGRDKYTITLLVENAFACEKPRRHVIYKHAIEQFIGEEPQQ